MIDREKVINGLREISCRATWKDIDRIRHKFQPIINDAIAMLKEQEIRELTIDEWKEWKNNPKRNPICELWEHDTSPMWVLNPDRIHEPALLMGKLKLFTGKPTLEQCKDVKWNDD